MQAVALVPVLCKRMHSEQHQSKCRVPGHQGHLQAGLAHETAGVKCGHVCMCVSPRGIAFPPVTGGSISSLHCGDTVSIGSGSRGHDFLIKSITASAALNGLPGPPSINNSSVPQELINLGP